MKKRARIFMLIGFMFALSSLLSSNTWASPFEINPMVYGGDNVYVNVGFYYEIDGLVDGHPGDNPAIGDISAKDYRTIYGNTWPAWRNGHETWEMGIQLEATGFSIYGDMTLTGSYGATDGYVIQDPGYMYAFTGGDGGIVYSNVILMPTAENPVGTVIPFIIQIETSGTPWAICQWEFKFDGVTVNQDNYDSFVFDLIVGESYGMAFDGGGQGTNNKFQTQNLVDGFLESGFELNFMQVPSPVPVPGAVWLLGSGLVSLVGLRRKYLH